MRRGNGLYTPTCKTSDTRILHVCSNNAPTTYQGRIGARHPDSELPRLLTQHREGHASRLTQGQVCEGLGELDGLLSWLGERLPEQHR